MSTHDIKEHPAPFSELASGLRDFEVRHNDREYKAGDTLVISEWDPFQQAFTGQKVTRRIKLVVSANSYGGMFHGAIGPNFVVLGLAPEGKGRR